MQPVCCHNADIIASKLNNCECFVPVGPLTVLFLNIEIPSFWYLATEAIFTYIQKWPLLIRK